MVRFNQNERGFGAIEALLVLTIVGILGFTGYFVWHAKQNSDKLLHQATSSLATNSKKKVANEANITPATVQYLDIPEWGVRILPATSLPKVTYVISDADNHEAAKLTFADMPAECAGFWSIGRAMAGQSISGYKDDTPEHRLSQQPKTVKQVGDYYFTLFHGQLSCGLETEKQATLIQLLAGNDKSPTYTVEAIPST